MYKKRAVAIGYATIDYVVDVKNHFKGTGTCQIRHLSEHFWPRAGGAALFSCVQLAKAGLFASPVTWLGSDATASLYERACRANRLNTEGIFVAGGTRTPTCILIYQPDGEYGCLFDSGEKPPRSLTAQQRSLIERSDLVILTAGPPELTEEALGLIHPDVTVAWIAKSDDVAYPHCLRKKCVARADYIFCNRGERDFVDSSCHPMPAKTQVLIETRGSKSVVVETRLGRFSIPVDPVDTEDVTGAGDTLAGATMAQLMAGSKDLEMAVRSGVKQASNFLKNRM